MASRAARTPFFAVASPNNFLHLFSTDPQPKSTGSDKATLAFTKSYGRNAERAGKPHYLVARLTPEANI